MAIFPVNGLGYSEFAVAAVGKKGDAKTESAEKVIAAIKENSTVCLLQLCPFCLIDFVFQ